MPLYVTDLPVARTDNVLIVFENVLLARAGTTVVASSEAASGNMDAENLLSEHRGKWWRSDSVAAVALEDPPEVVLTFELGEASDIDWFSYHWANVQVPFSVELWDGDPDTDGELLASSGWVAPIVKAEPDDFVYGLFPVELGPTERQVAELAADYRLQSFWHFEEVQYGVAYVRVRFDVSDGDNGGADFLQVSLPIAGRAWSPAINMSLGTDIAPVDYSEISKTIGGAALGLKRPTNGRFTFSLEHLSDDEAFKDLYYGWRLRQGALARVFAYQEPTAAKRRLFYDGSAFVGALEEFSGVEIGEHEGEMDSVIVAKQVRQISIEETQ